MDAFRRLQKIDCANGGKKELKYGCPCCRRIADQNKFKKVSRKMARRRLNQEDLPDRIITDSDLTVLLFN